MEIKLNHQVSSRAKNIIEHVTAEWNWTSNDNISRVGEEIFYDPGDSNRVDVCVGDEWDAERGEYFNYWRCYRSE